MIHISESSRIARVGIAAVLASLGLVGNGWAITIETKVTDSEAGRTFTHSVSPSTAVVVTNSPAVNPTSRDVKLTNNPPMSVSVTGTGPTSYGYAAAADTVANNVATKTTAPTVVMKPGFTVSKTTAYSDPVGPGTYRIDILPTNTNQDPNQIVAMRYFVPGSNSPDVNHSIDDSAGASGENLNSSLPSQGVVVDTANLSDLQLNGYFDVHLSVSAHVSQAAIGLDADLFSGTVTFHNGVSKTVDFGGDFNIPSVSADIQDAGNQMIITLTGLQNLVRGFSVKANTDFDFTLEQSMSIGTDADGIDNGPDFLDAGTLSRNAGALGLFTSGFTTQASGGFNLAAVPEPSTIVLAGLAGMVLAGYGWRKRTS
jgi:hypothetical protein